MSIPEIKKTLQKNSNKERAINFRKFFKHCKADVFLGVPTATIRKIAKEFFTISLDDIQTLMQSSIHDERALAHAILVLKYKKADEKTQTHIFKFYVKNRKFIQDWDGVDDSAPYIAGPYLLQRDKSILYKLADSKRIWDRRIAIVTTLHFIRQHQVTDTLKLAEKLLHDKEDLIHKAVGWMLREVGKKDIAALKKFLHKHQFDMPRTMLRYAIERFPENERQTYLINSRTKA